MSNNFEKIYNRTYWINNTHPAINETNLNNLEAGVNEIDNRIITLDVTKFDKTEAAGLIKSFDLDRTTGIITITKYNGSITTIDTLLEKIAVNLDFDEVTQKLIVILDDGTEKEIDLSAFITQYEFLDSDTIGFAEDETGKVVAIVKEGSIEEKHLQPNYLADVKTEVGKAEAARTGAESADESAHYYSNLSMSYANGLSGIRDGEESDCAKYYKEKAEEAADRAEQVSNVGIATEEKAGLVKPDGSTIGIKADGTIKAIGMENMQDHAFPFTVAETEGNIDPTKTIGENMGLLLKSQSTFRQGIQEAIDKLNNIKTDLPYNNYLEFISAFNSMPANMYKVGQGILIGALGVPDLSIFSLESANIPYNYTTDEQFVKDIKAGGNTHPYVQVGYYNITIKEGEKTNLEPINALLGATDISKTGDGTLTGIAKRNYDLLGTDSISGLGNGTVTGAISAVNTDLSNLASNTPRRYDGVISDFNAALTQGQYLFAAGAANGPGASYGSCKVIVSTGDTHNNVDNWIWQIVYATTNAFFYRSKVNNGAWSAWVTVVTDNTLARKNITFTHNTNYVEASYTWCQKSGNIVILGVDLNYNVPKQFESYVLGTLAEDYPNYYTIFANADNSSGEKVQLWVNTSGELTLNTSNSAVGMLTNIRCQLMWIV